MNLDFQHCTSDVRVYILIKSTAYGSKIRNVNKLNYSKVKKDFGQKTYT